MSSLPPAVAATAIDGKLSLKNKSINDQIIHLRDLRLNNPEKAKNIFQQGELLITYSKNGEYRKFKLLLDSINEDDIYVYFISQTFYYSLILGHLMISSCIIDNGYPFQSNYVPCIIHQCLCEGDDHRCSEIIEFLVRKGLDVDVAAPKTWLTPLHIAVQRNLIETIKLLITFKADVNAVAAGDVMPLTIAKNNDASATRDEIVELLEKNGAKVCWKKNIANTDTTYHSISTNAFTTSSNSGGERNQSNIQSKPLMVSFKGGSGSTTIDTCSSSISSSSSSSSVCSTNSDAKFVRFTGGGGLSQLPTPPIPAASFGCNSVDVKYADGSATMMDVVNRIADSLDSMIFSTQPSLSSSNTIDSGTSVATTDLSDDGGMMFSTG